MQTHQSQSTSGRSWQQFYGERRFLLLLVLLAALLAGPPVLLERGFSAVWFDGLTSLLLLAAILSLCADRRRRGIALLLGIPTFLIAIGGHAVWVPLSSWVIVVGQMCQVALFVVAAMMIVKSVFQSDSLRFDSILGAVCGYIFLGLGWAVFYGMVERIQPGSFAMGPSLDRTVEDLRVQSHVLTYFSFITLTTVGYGDVVPRSPAIQSCAFIEAITGQFYMAVIVAGLVSLFIANRKVGL